MFKTEILQQLSEVFNSEICFDDILKCLDLDLHELTTQLLHAAQCRIQEQANCTAIIQSAIHLQSYDIAYLFSPFILSNLNQKTIYTTPKTKTVSNIFNQYFDTSEMELAKNTEILQDLNFSIQFSNIEQDNTVFLYQYLFAALCNKKVKNIFILSEIKTHSNQLKSLEIQFGVRIFMISSTHKKLDILDLDMRKLLFKNKDVQYVELCADFSEMNAQILVPLVTLTLDQATHLVDDMFYSEHVFEKLSVYSEYMTTRIFNAKQLSTAS